MSRRWHKSRHRSKRSLRKSPSGSRKASHACIRDFYKSALPVVADSARALLSNGDWANAAQSLPLRAKLQRVLHCRGREIRNGPRNMERSVPNLPLPSVGIKRLRSAMTGKLFIDAVRSRAPVVAVEAMECEGGIRAGVVQGLGRKEIGIITRMAEAIAVL